MKYIHCCRKYFLKMSPHFSNVKVRFTISINNPHNTTNWLNLCGVIASWMGQNDTRRKSSTRYNTLHHLSGFSSQLPSVSFWHKFWFPLWLFLWCGEVLCEEKMLLCHIFIQCSSKSCTRQNARLKGFNKLIAISLFHNYHRI